mmetsp:Transcript_5776/g.10337  ORF Transcript_5776/g.10337 Transcript_5776/m.10337 type:complete len:507 (-) Transcript_5776:46-1566(-)
MKRTLLPLLAAVNIGRMGNLGFQGFLRPSFSREKDASGSVASLVLPARLVETVYMALADGDCIPRRWHPEGREGIPIQTGEPGKRLLPILAGAEQRLPEMVAALLAEGKMELVQRRSAWCGTPKRRLEPEASVKEIPKLSPPVDSFTFAELFAGIGGFRVALESLGGRCVFASEIEPFTRGLYTQNFGEDGVVGDIQDVPDSEIPEHDLLVAGFPCQPFSTLGDQPGFEDSKGLLFREIVRVLAATRSKMFLLENVPGLAQCDEGKAIKAIRQALEHVGYHVVLKTVNAKNLTAQSRKRIFFMGFRHGEADVSDFSIPAIPDLRLRADDIFEPEEDLEASGLMEDYTVSEEHFSRLQESRKWSRRGGMTDTLAWGDKVCATLVAHYGTSISKGNSQLVPRRAPFRPRRFTPRECARLMGFPNSYKLTEKGDSQSASVWFRALYKMFGNSVCPPLVAVLAGAMLGHVRGHAIEPDLGRSVALRLALEALAPESCQRLRPHLDPSWHS